MDPDQFQETLKRLDRLEQILEKVENNTRATPDEIWHQPRDDKVTVSVRINIQTVGDIDNVNQQFYMYFILFLEWKEPRLKGMKREDVSWEDEWSPRLNFKNQLTSDRFEKKYRLNYEPGDDIPKVNMSIYVAGTFKEVLELNDFPFDYQSLTINMDSDWPDTILTFEKHNEMKDSVVVRTFAGCHEWTLCPHVVSGKVEVSKNQAGSHRIYPHYSITCHVKRKPNFYMWNIVLIMGLIMALTFSSFSVDISAPEDRLSVTLTLLLTSVAFKFVVSQSLPNISYLTYLDQYVICCMVIQCVIAVQNAIGGKIPTESQETYDTVCVCVLGGIVVILHVIFGILLTMKVKKRNAFLSGMTKEYDRLAEEYNEKYQQKKKYLESQHQTQELQKAVEHVHEDETNNTPKKRKKEKRKRKVEDTEIELTSEVHTSQ